MSSVLHPSLSIASVTAAAAVSGIAVAASSRTSSRAPGISRAIACALPTGNARRRRATRRRPLTRRMPGAGELGVRRPPRGPGAALQRPDDAYLLFLGTEVYLLACPKRCDPAAVFPVNQN